MNTKLNTKPMTDQIKPGSSGIAPDGTGRETMRIVIVGHVDHGKSTLVGRLFHETGSLPDGRYEEIQAMCQRRGMAFEWAFLTDALQAERDQGITIDTTQVWFKTARRDYVIIDAPGHREFLKNMITGAASAEAALLIIDAKEGVQEQSRRHGYLLHLLGIRQVAVVVNKMDLVAYDQGRFGQVEQEIRAYLGDIGIKPQWVIPVSARAGDMIAQRSSAADWYEGPTIVEALDHFDSEAPPAALPLRFPVQDVYKFDDRRIIAGRIESGRLQVGDRLLFSPGDKQAKVSSIEMWRSRNRVVSARAGQSIGVTLDEHIFVERGHVASHIDTPPIETNVFRASVFWLGHQPLAVGRRYVMKIGTMSTLVDVQSVENIVDTGDLSVCQAQQIDRGAVGEVVLRSRSALAVDEFASNRRMGRFVLIEEYQICGGGVLSMEGYPDQRRSHQARATNVTAVNHQVSAESRAVSNGHRAGILWMTGLSGSGKSTLSLELEQHLFLKGYHVYTLDGDNLRHGLNADLGFSPDDRVENIRRAGELAGLFTDAGILVIAAFISPYREDRHRARSVRPELFHEVYVKAGLDVCEKRDVKGLYAKARCGEISEFTGISSPYEEPENPELIIDTEHETVTDSLTRLVDYVESHFKIKAARTPVALSDSGAKKKAMAG